MKPQGRVRNEISRLKALVLAKKPSGRASSCEEPPKADTKFVRLTLLTDDDSMTESCSASAIDVSSSSNQRNEDNSSILSQEKRF